MCRLSWNLGVSTSENPQGLSRLLQRLLYLLSLPQSVLGNKTACWPIVSSNMTLILLQEIAPPVQSNRTIGGSHSRSGRSEMAKKSSPRPVTELRTHSPYCNHDDDISLVFITSTRDFIRILYMFHASEPNSTDISMTVKSWCDDVPRIWVGIIPFRKMSLGELLVVQLDK